MTDLEARLVAILRESRPLMQVLETARELALPDWLVFSGAIYQRVLNHQTGRDPDYGVRDYDLGYFDASDTSYEAEDVVIRKVAAAFEPPLRELVEVRNQAPRPSLVRGQVRRGLQAALQHPRGARSLRQPAVRRRRAA